MTQVRSQLAFPLTTWICDMCPYSGDTAAKIVQGCRFRNNQLQVREGQWALTLVNAFIQPMDRAKAQLPSNAVNRGVVFCNEGFKSMIYEFLVEKSHPYCGFFPTRVNYALAPLISFLFAVHLPMQDRLLLQDKSHLRHIANTLFSLFCPHC
jgi:hypothetical protein